MLGLSLVIINRDIKEYCFPSLMAFFLICSNSIIFPGIYTFYKIRYGTFTIKYSKLNILFLLACYISVFSNLYIDYRILMFTGMMLICAPFYVSKKVFLFERKILSVILLFFHTALLFFHQNSIFTFCHWTCMLSSHRLQYQKDRITAILFL